MATIAEMLIGSTAQAIQAGPEQISRGAQLAQTVESIQSNRERLEMAKQEHQINKVNRVMDAIEKGSNFKDKAAQNMFFKNYLPSMVKALKLDDFFTPETLQYVQGSQEVRDKILGLRLDIQDKINNGQLRGAEIYNYAKSRLNPEELALLDTNELIEQQKFAASEAGKSQRAELVQFGQATRQERQIGSTGEQALAKAVADRFEAYQAGGGKAGMESSLAALEEAAQALESGRVKTGGITTKIPGLRSETAQSVLNEEMLATKTQAQSALNNVLRATLGAQFTQQEGERVLNQIWDDKLKPSVNVKKIRDKIKELRANIKNAESEFKRQGFPVSQDNKPKLNPSLIQAYAQKYNISVEEAQKALNAAGYE